MKKLIIIALSLFLGTTLFAQTGLKTGDAAPQFTATDNAGKKINLKALLKTHQAVLLVFYRGQWCPYCNKHLQQLQDSLQLLTDKNVFVVTITPETSENINKTVEKTKASFSVIHDVDYKIMQAYGVNYVLDAGTVTKYKQYGVDLDANNGNGDHVLPVPATYLIDKNGKIKFVHFDKDYRKRASVRQILAAL